jgi:hypothetical protein
LKRRKSKERRLTLAKDIEKKCLMKMWDYEGKAGEVEINVGWLKRIVRPILTSINFTVHLKCK